MPAPGDVLPRTALLNALRWRASVGSFGGLQTRGAQGRKNITFNRRSLALGGAGALSVAIMGRIPQAAAQAGDEAAVKQAVEAFRKAMLANDRAQLDALSADQLSYGHSGGKVQNKAEFLAGSTAGKSKMLSLEYKDPTIRIVGPVAIVRFHWLHEAQDVADGKKSGANLHILMNWVKQGSDWKLLSRGATKL